MATETELQKEIERRKRTDMYRPYLPGMSQQLNQELTEIFSKFEPMASGHEGYAVIKEGLDRLWEQVKADGGGDPNLKRRLALRVAANALRFFLDVCVIDHGKRP